jgi:hypothetical protein
MRNRKSSKNSHGIFIVSLIRGIHEKMLSGEYFEASVLLSVRMFFSHLYFWLQWKKEKDFLSEKSCI